MFAVDTNVLVRIITADDAEQSPKARRLVDENPVFVSRTVLLETEWVLRGTYQLSRRDVLHHLSRFIGLPQVRMEAPMQVAQALEWSGQGMDFADALHLAAGEECEAFVTFDRKLASAARKSGAGEVKVL